MSSELNPYTKWLGIPSHGSRPDHYSLLGLLPGTSDGRAIERAHRQRQIKVRKYQRGNTGDVASRVLNELAEAYVCLRDADKRARYDRELGLQPAPKPPVQRPSSAETSSAAVSPARPIDGEFPLDKPPRPAEPDLRWIALGIVAIVAVVLFTVLGVATRRRALPPTDETIAAVTAMSATSPPQAAESFASDVRAGQAATEAGAAGGTTQTAAGSETPGSETPSSETPIDDDYETVSPLYIPLVPPEAESQAELPDNPFADPADPLVIGPLEDDPLLALVQGSSAGQRPRDISNASFAAGTADKADSQAATRRPPSPTNVEGLRTWTEKSGRFSIEARFVDFASGRVELVSSNGDSSHVAITELSDADRAWVMERLEQMRREQIEPLLAQARERIAAGDFRQAKGVLLRANHLANDDSQPYFLLGLLEALVEREYLEAAKRFKRCVSKNSADVPSLNNLALTEIRRQEFPAAIRHFQNALAVEPDSPVVAHNVARMLMLIQRFDTPLPSAAQNTLTAMHESTERLTNTVQLAKIGWVFMDFDTNPRAGIEHLAGSLGRFRFEDRGCSVCNARGSLPCTNQSCRGGGIPSTYTNTIRGPNGQIVIQRRHRRLTCPTCNGTNSVECRACNNGIDPALGGGYGGRYGDRSAFSLPGFGVPAEFNEYGFGAGSDEPSSFPRVRGRR